MAVQPYDGRNRHACALQLAPSASPTGRGRWPKKRPTTSPATGSAGRRRRRSFFNGAVYLMRDHAIDGDVLTGTLFKTDFNTFLYWRERSLAGDADRARMFRRLDHPLGRRLRAAGPPGARPAQLRTRLSAERGDRRRRRARRHDRHRRQHPPRAQRGDRPRRRPVQRQPGYIVARLGRRSRSASNGAASCRRVALRERILAFTRAQTEPELDDIVIVRTQADIDESTMPRHARVLLRALLPA